jgi:hypothetical protein
MTWLSRCSHPLHHVVGSSDLVSVVRQQDRLGRNVELRGRRPPVVWRVRRDRQEFNVECLELGVLVQVTYLQDAAPSTRAHAEIEQDRLPADEVTELNVPSLS